ncbi:MAG: hypothetical protein M3Z08_22675, partial [Chloroflexota bacterium]|nr:hypothetical protein [Chloroflexota bacterium]
MPIVVVLACMVFGIELLYYVFFIPDPKQKPLTFSALDKYLGVAAYTVAYVLSLLRAPLGLLPYLVKIVIFFGLKVRYESARSTYFREVLNMLGDVLNLGGSSLCIFLIVGKPASALPGLILYLPIWAECVRLLTERVPIIYSAAWQLTPHKRVARLLLACQHSGLPWRVIARCLARYCRYYAPVDAERAAYVLETLKQRARQDGDLACRLEYMHAFRIMPLEHGLRGGSVRDVARGEVWIHAAWTNDPWLLVGMAIRRAPWMFDPRYLRRPPYYMTQSNRLATLLVLQHARYSPPFAVFQFGHEIRVARLHLFYLVLRWLGADIEAKVLADGTFQFDQLICSLDVAIHPDHAPEKQRPLWSDEEAIA